jgi:nucleotide-binding universal stress UspA family protein
VLQTILVALDGSETSDQVIQSLNNLQIQLQTKIILCHVLPAALNDTDLEADRPHPSQESFYQTIEKQLYAYQTQIPGSNLEVVSGDPSEEIIRLAKIYQADLIVIGTRGLTGVKRIIEGSVSSQVVADAPCSVLVVKSDREAN